MKPDQENDDDEGDVTDEDEAADIDEEKAAALLEKSGAGAEGAAKRSGNVTPTATPPMKSKAKKSKKVQRLVFYTRVQDSQNRGEMTVQATGLDVLKQRTLDY